VAEALLDILTAHGVSPGAVCGTVMALVVPCSIDARSSTKLI